MSRATRGRFGTLGLILSLVMVGTQCSPLTAETAGRASSDDMVIVADHLTKAKIVSSPTAGPLERRGAQDLSSYIERMTGVATPVLATQAAIDKALASNDDLIVLGSAAAALRPDLARKLMAAVKPQPSIRADGIVLKHEGRRVFVFGNNDRSHYFAVAELLRQWGVRWFMPGPFGECVPDARELKIGHLDEVAASPFEVRTFVVGWLGDESDTPEFLLHNMMTDPSDLPASGHSLGKYTKGLSKSDFDIPLLAPSTARQVADRTDKLFATGTTFSLAMEDGVYENDDPAEKAKRHLQWDPMFHTWSITDAMLSLYEATLKILRQRHPDSPSRVGFLAYLNMTLPPVEHHDLDRALFAELAPIAIDPIHGVGDPRSPELNEYARMVTGWANVMHGRVTIYDYDQGMLVWRDLPAPSHLAFASNVKFYRQAGILGVGTESRGALATTFINLYMRGRLLWNPDQNVDALLEDFYKAFYGPAAAPMSKYWGDIFAAWRDTNVTEHEYFLAPAVYTRPLIEKLRLSLDQAELAVDPLTRTGRELSANEKLYIKRLRFTRLSFRLIDSYIRMVEAAARDADYEAAVAAGERGLGERAELTAMDKSFTSTALEQGSAFWIGEVEQYDDLRTLTNGQRGTMVMRLPLTWDVHREPVHGDQPGQAAEPKAAADVPSGWRPARTDLYLEGQDVFPNTPKGPIADIWYKTDFSLGPDDGRGQLRIHFPGLFGSCRLYLDRKLVGERRQELLWWLNDYRFDWDIALPETSKKPHNELLLNCASDGQQSGMFRRPFIYRARSPS